MSYLRSIKPRFYIDNINWLTAKGESPSITNDGESLVSGCNVLDIADMKPANTCSWDTNGNNTDVDIGVDFQNDHVHNFVAILNHNLNTVGAEVTLKYNAGGSQISSYSGIINANEGSANWAAPTADGDTIFSFTELTAEDDLNIVITPTGVSFSAEIEIGCIIIGKYHTMPFGPSQGRGLNFQFPENILESEGGQRYSNIPWTGAPQNSYAPFRGNNLYQFSGRTGHELLFSYVDDDDILRSDLSAVTDSDTFMHDVYQKILGSHIPFVFTLNSASTIKGDYLFARMFNLSMNELAYRLFDLSMRIEEEF